MKSFLIAEKVGMTRMFDAAGTAVGATVLKVLPATVLRLKTQEKDGYEAVQVGAGTDKLGKNAGKAIAGQGGGKAYRVIKEFPQTGELEKGQTIGLEQVKAGDVVNVTSTSKGKGFQGTVKRYNFSTGPKTHGSRNYRPPGSIGGTGAARVFPGQKMPGHMGAETVTTRGLAVVAVHEDEEAVLVRGAVPGPKGALVVLRVTGQQARGLTLPKEEPKEEKTDDAPAEKADVKEEAKADDSAKAEDKPAKDEKTEAKSDAKAEDKKDDAKPEADKEAK
jgi:large subunit ribosomal protein L3